MDTYKLRLLRATSVFVPRQGPWAMFSTCVWTKNKHHVDNWTKRKSIGLTKNELNRLFGFCRLKGSVLLQRKSFGSRGTGSGLIAAATGMRIFRTAAFGVGRIHSYLFLRTCSLFPPIRFSRTIMGKQQQQTKLDQGLLKHPGGGETYRIF